MGDLPAFKPIFAEICKIDDEQHMVFGWASTDKRDSQGEIITRDAIANALPDYMRFANIREMHTPSAVGLAKEVNVTDKGLWLGAKVYDERAWVKVKSGVYKGYSVGGRVTQRDPDDSTIITAMELTEISLVDRPANPEALFEMFKRVGGKMVPRSLQKWDCGLHDHQHEKRLEADECMEKQFRGEVTPTTVLVNLDVNSIDPEMVKRFLAEPSSVAAIKAILEKTAVSPQPQSDSGKFITHTAAATNAKAKSDYHAGEAIKARKEEVRHKGRAEVALNASDTAAMSIHEHLASEAASLASSHERQAENYRNLATRHTEAAATTHKAKESDMARTVTDAEKAAEDAVKKLAQAITDPIVKVKINHNDEMREARQDAMNHTEEASSHEVSATESRALAAKARAEGKPDEADQHDAEADQHDITAAHHHDLADGFHELAAHHAEAASSSQECDHQDMAAQATEAGVELAGQAEKCDMMGKAHDAMGGTAATAGDKDQAAHHAAMAGDYRDSAAKKTELAKRMSGIASKHIAAIAKAVKGTDLNKVDFGYALKDGTGWFGKRDFSDEKRQELADKGHAMPDGSFPIENKEDLKNAVAAFGRAKDPAAAKAHIIARAKALSCTDELPKDWVDSTKKSEGGDDDAEKDAAGAALAAKKKKEEEDAEAEKRVKEEAEKSGSLTKACPTCKANNAKAAPKCINCGNDMNKAYIPTTTKAEDMKCKSCDKGIDKQSKECPHCGEDTMGKGARKAALITRYGSLQKGMVAIATLAGVLDQITYLGENVKWEQALESDTSSELPAKMKQWLSDGMTLLSAMVAEEVPEIMDDTDVDVGSGDDAMIALAAKGVTIANILKAAVPTDRAKEPKGVYAKTLALAKRLEAVKVQTTGAATDVATKQVAALDRLTNTMVALTKDVSLLRRDGLKKDSEIQALKAHVNNLSKTPNVPKSKGGAFNVRKSEDMGNNGDAHTDVATTVTNTSIAKAMEAEPGAARAAALLVAAHDAIYK